MKTQKKILVCPLDWGLGHATRLVPVIEMLLQKNHKVIFGADNGPLAFLQEKFPTIKTIKFQGFSAKYPAKGSMALAMIMAYPEMLKQAKKSNQILQEIIEKEKIDVVISDNRYELSSKKAYCIFITHQLNIQTPGLTTIAKHFIQKKINGYIRQFDELWIPDFEGENNLSGKLAHNVKMPIENHHFIGPLSRFSLLPKIELPKTNDLLILLSGPEPQRSLLEEILFQQALGTKLKTVVLQGKPGLSSKRKEKNVQILSHLPDAELASLIKSSKTIICRSGYSTIMDFAVLGSKAIFIPTPGQTEQEYLAERFLKKNIYYSEKQKDFNLKIAIELSNVFTGISLKFENSALERRVERLQNI